MEHGVYTSFHTSARRGEPIEQGAERRPWTDAYVTGRVVYRFTAVDRSRKRITLLSRVNWQI